MAEKHYLDKEGLAYLLQKLELGGFGSSEPGEPGKDAKIVSATVTVEPGWLENPTCTVVVGGEPGNQTLDFTFSGLQGKAGEPGKDGTATFDGTSGQIVLGDGTYQDIEEFLDQYLGASFRKQALQEKKNEADDLLASASKSTDGSDVYTDQQWVDDSTYEALQQAIEKAETALQGEDKDAIQQAQTELESAMDAFTEAKKAGTKQHPDISGLEKKIQEATEALGGATVSESNGADVDTDKYWVDQDAHDALDTAIQTATGVKDQGESADYQDVEDQKTALDAAIKAFNEAKKYGTKFKPGASLDSIPLETLDQWADDVCTDHTKYDELVGQEKTYNISGIGEKKHRLIGLAQDKNAEGKLVAYTWQASEVVANQAMEETADTTGGWTDSQAKTYLNDTLKAAYPAEVSAEMVTVEKKSAAPLTVDDASAKTTVQKGTVNKTSDTMFLAAASEMTSVTNLTDGAAAEGGNDYPVNKDEGDTYQYWSEHGTLADHIVNNVDTPAAVWTRSISPVSTAEAATNYRSFAADGSLGSNSAEIATVGFMPCFCTGLSTIEAPLDTGGLGEGGTLEDATWGNVQAAAQDSAEHPEKYQDLVETEKTVAFGSYGSVVLVLLDMNNYDLASGGTKNSGFLFGVKDIMFEHRMHSSDSTSGGWGACELRNFLNSTEFTDQVPEAFKAMVQTVKIPYFASVSVNDSTAKTQMQTGQNLSYSNDQFFIPSSCEVATKTGYNPSGSNGDAYNGYPIITGEGTQYAYWKKHDNMASRIKKHQGAADWWWTRSISPYSASGAQSSYRHVGGGGGVYNHNGASDTYGGVVPCFCIK